MLNSDTVLSLASLSHSRRRKEVVSLLIRAMLSVT